MSISVMSALLDNLARAYTATHILISDTQWHIAICPA
jgi:hypothetical protein